MEVNTFFTNWCNTCCLKVSLGTFYRDPFVGIDVFDNVSPKIVIYVF